MSFPSAEKIIPFLIALFLLGFLSSGQCVPLDFCYGELVLCSTFVKCPCLYLLAGTSGMLSQGLVGRGRGCKGSYHLRFSGIRLLRGGGYPPFPLRKKTFFLGPKTLFFAFFYAFLALFGPLYGLFGPFLTLFNEKNIIFSPFRKKFPGKA